MKNLELKSSNYIEKHIGCRYPLINSKKMSQSMLVGTYRTDNISYIPNVLNFVNESKVIFSPVLLNVCKFKNAYTSSHSDIIRVGKKCYWEKHNKYFMFKNLPFDKDLIHYDRKNLYLKPMNIVDLTLEDAVSLVGALDFSWAHFLVQYFPKIEILKKSIQNKNITIIISETLDKNCKDIIKFIKPKNWKIYELKQGNSIQCRNLYTVDNTSWITDHSNSSTLGDVMIYDIALQVLKEMVEKYKKKYQIINKKERKIYLRRDDTNRSLLNISEVDQVLESYGFEIVYGNEYSIIEKINLFSQASVIVGPASSGFVNMIFCSENINIIALINRNRIWDTYFSTLSQYFKMNFTYIPSSFEIDVDNPHTSYGIDITDLKSELKRII